MLNSRHINDQDWIELNKWFGLRKFPAPNPRFIPPTGVMVRHGEQRICAGYLFKSDARLATIDHLISTTVEMDKKLRDEALAFLITTLCDLARESGILIVTAASNIARLNTRYETLGFIKGDTNETHFGRIL